MSWAIFLFLCYTNHAGFFILIIINHFIAKKPYFFSKNPFYCYFYSSNGMGCSTSYWHKSVTFRRMGPPQRSTVIRLIMDDIIPIGPCYRLTDDIMLSQLIWPCILDRWLPGEVNVLERVRRRVFWWQWKREQWDGRLWEEAFSVDLSGIWAYD